MGHKGWGCRGLPLQLAPQLEHASCLLLKDKQYYESLTQWLQFAGGEGIPNVALNTGAGGHVVHDPAPCIDATSPRAGVDALVPLACFVGWAVRVDDTLWSARHVRISKVFRDALARASVPLPIANCIGSAR